MPYKIKIHNDHNINVKKTAETMAIQCLSTQLSPSVYLTTNFRQNLIFLEP